MTFKLYAQGVVGSQNDIKSLNDRWKSPEIQSIFDHVKRSLDINQDLANSATTHPHGWVKRAQGQKQAEKQQDSGDPSERPGAIDSDEEIARIILDFRKRHPDIVLKTQGDNRSISVCSIFRAFHLLLLIYITDAVHVH